MTEIASTMIKIDVPQQTVSTFSSRCLTRCVSAAKGTAQCIKRLGLGMAMGVPSAGLNLASVFIARQLGVISNPGVLDEMKEASQTSNIFQLDFDALENSTCPLQELSEQFNESLYSIVNGLEISPLMIKVFIGSVICVYPAISEELIFRGLIQDVLLKRIPSWVLKKIHYSHENILDTKIAKAARIIFTSALFAASHLFNQGIFTDSYVQAQVVGTFALGIIFGAIKESSLGLVGSTGAHFMNNLIAISPLLFSC